jgi:hypothetical protein
LPHLLLVWLFALVATHALAWSPAAHPCHGVGYDGLETHLSAPSADHGHADCVSAQFSVAHLPRVTVGFGAQPTVDYGSRERAPHRSTSSVRVPGSRAPPA